MKRNKRKAVAVLDGEISTALRDIAGWPREAHSKGGFRSRSRHMTIVRDQFGNVISSVESIDEDEYDEYSDDYSK